MSVMINGTVNIPTSCISCHMQDSEDDCLLQAKRHWQTWDEMREGCPIVEIPDELADAISLVIDNYKYAVKEQWVHDPVAWALYQAWKEVNENE